MLVLSRKPGEAIHIGDEIVVKIIKVSGNAVRLAFDAPAEVRIHRGEVWERIRQETDASEDTSDPIDMVSV
jgi:carbon storage regulator